MAMKSEMQFAALHMCAYAHHNIYLCTAFELLLLSITKKQISPQQIHGVAFASLMKLIFDEMSNLKTTRNL